MALLTTQYRATMLRYLRVLIYEMKEVDNYNAGFENGLQVEFCKAPESCNISVCILKCDMGNWRSWRTTGHNIWVLWILWLYPHYNGIFSKTSKLRPARIMQLTLLMFGCVNMQSVWPMFLNSTCDHSLILYHAAWEKYQISCFSKQLLIYDLRGWCGKSEHWFLGGKG